MMKQPSTTTERDPLDYLQTTLCLLALPVIGQVRLVTDDCARVAVLTSAFCATHRAVHKIPKAQLTTEQALALARLDEQLAQVQRTACLQLAHELALRTSREWRQVRMMARETLVRFRWTLDLPLPGMLGGVWQQAGC
jgi:hypothetical protein